MIQMDADFSHQPKYVAELIAADKGADMVSRSRFARGGGVEEAWPLFRKLLT